MVQPVDPSTVSVSPSFGARVADTINPLQHIPFISHLYREITGDAITPDAQFAGGFLFGGPLGALSAAAGMIVSGLVSETRSETVQTAWSSKSVDDAPGIKFRNPWKFNA